MDHNQMTSRGADRERRKKYIMLALVATFALLLLVFIILLGISIANAIPDRTPTEDAPVTDNTPTDELPSDGTTSDGTTPDGDTPADETPELTFVTLPSSALSEGSLILVNATHAYFPTSESHLINVATAKSQAKLDCFLVANNNLRMDQNAYQALSKMLVDFSEATGHVDVQLTAAYRSVDQQNAMGSATKGGYSDHHTGYTFALNIFRGSKSYEIAADAEYQWIYDNCYKYGLIARYPTDKVSSTGVGNYPECFRYVGYVHASVMKSQGLCLEEYLPFMRAYTYDAPLTFNTDDGSSYMLYYVLADGAETQIPLPENSNYTISGDNDRGFIVTVKMP